MKLNRLLMVAAVGMGALLVSQQSMATETKFPEPKKPFSAYMKMSVKEEGSGQSYEAEGMLYYTSNAQRREITSLGQKRIFIKTESESLMVIPDQGIYMENRNSGSRDDPEAMIRKGKLKLTEDGTEKINGEVTKRFKVESVEKGRDNFTGYAWFNRYNIPVRFKGISSDGNRRIHFEQNHSKIKVGPQNPALFKAPKTARRIPTGFGGMGGGPANMTPEQIEQMKEMMKKQRRQ